MNESGLSNQSVAFRPRELYSRQTWRHSRRGFFRKPTVRKAVPRLWALFAFVGDDVNVHGGGVVQEAVEGGEVEEPAQTSGGRAAEDDLRDMFLAHELGGGIGHAPAYEPHHLGAQVFGESEIGGERVLFLLAPISTSIHINHIELGGQSPGHARAARALILRARSRADA